ncbi:MAG: hypothetical protein ACR2HH_09365 [Chthoniobacterales bacterium]
MKPLVIISTRLPPATCGIGTYSWLLREHWPNESRAIEFLVVEDVGSSSSDRISVFGNDAARMARELDRIGAADLLLHYAGRAYQRFGCPTWLPGVLAKWKRKFPDSRLMIFFHEMPSIFPRTSRHHWLGKLNTTIIRRLVAKADVLVTNTEPHRAQLRKLAKGAEVHLVPVGSNIERAPMTSGARARTEFAIFGLPFGREQTLQLFAAPLRRWQAAGTVTRLHIIGPEDARFAAKEISATVHHGVLPSSEVADLLRRVGFALTNVSAETWSKSTTFMACAANHCPMIISGTRAESGPLSWTVGIEEVDAISEPELVRRTSALASWYEENAAWPVTAKRIAALWPRQKTTR